MYRRTCPNPDHNHASIADDMACRVAYEVSGDVACEDNWPAIEEAIKRRVAELIEQILPRGDGHGR